MRTDLHSCLGQMQNGFEARADSLMSLYHLNKRMEPSASWIRKEGRNVDNIPWKPTRLIVWNGVRSLLRSLCSTCCTNQAEEPREPPKRCSPNIISQASKAGQGSVYVHNHCHNEQSSTQQDKPPPGRALEMLQARPPADSVLLKGPLDKTPPCCAKLEGRFRLRPRSCSFGQAPKWVHTGE